MAKSEGSLWTPIADHWGTDGWCTLKNFFGAANPPLDETTVFQIYVNAKEAVQDQLSDDDQDLRFWYVPQGQQLAQELRGKRALHYWPDDADGGFDGYFARIATMAEVAEYTAFLRFNGLRYLPDAVAPLKVFMAEMFETLGVPRNGWHFDVHAGRYLKTPFLRVHTDGLHNLLWLVKGEAKSLWTWSAANWEPTAAHYEACPFESPTGTNNIIRVGDLLYFSPKTYHIGASPTPTVTANITIRQTPNELQRTLEILGAELSGRLVARGCDLECADFAGPLSQCKGQVSTFDKFPYDVFIDELRQIILDGTLMTAINTDRIARWSALGALTDRQTNHAVNYLADSLPMESDAKITATSKIQCRQFNPLIWETTSKGIVFGVGGVTFELGNNPLVVCLLDLLAQSNKTQVVVATLIANARALVTKRRGAFQLDDADEMTDDELIDVIAQLVQCGALQRSSG